MIRLGCAMLMMVGGCSFKAGLGGTNGTNSASRSGPDSVRAAPSKNFTVPDLLFLPEAEARKALKDAGHAGSVSFAEGLCGSTLDNKIVDKGLVCYQAPPGGRVQSSRLSVQIRVQTENPRHGRIGEHSEWHLMPDVVGMSLDAAMAKLVEAGFSNREKTRVSRVTKVGCKPNHVCSTHPAALNRSGQRSERLLVVGADPSDANKHAEKEPTPESRDSSKSDDADADAKGEDKAEDFF